MPEPHALALLVFTAAAFFLYTRSWVRLEFVSLLLLAALATLFYVFPYAGEGVRLTEADIFAAFGHPALIAICSLMILAHGLTMTGALEPAVRVLDRVWRRSASLGLLLTLVLAGAASGFVNDTPVLVMALPMLLGIAKRSGYSARRTLMPVNFAILAGGMLTSIGTSTNLLVLSIAVELGMAPMGLFDFTGVAVASLLVALPYLWLVAPRLLPEGEPGIQPAANLYAARLVVADGQRSVVGQTMAALAHRLGRPVPAVGLVREDEPFPLGDAVELEPGDILSLRDTADGLRELSASLSVELIDGEGVSRHVERDIKKADIYLAEVVVGTDSDLVDRTLGSMRFAERHEVAVVGIGRGVDDLLRASTSLGDIRLMAGDMLLVQGSRENIEALGSQPGVLVLSGDRQMPRLPLARTALAIMAAVVLMAAMKWLPIHVAALAGVTVMVATGCVRLEGLGRALSLEVVLLVASSVALGRALVVTGAADWIATGVVALAEPLHASWRLAAFMALSAVLTNFVSNSAAAAVGTPIAIATARSLGQPLEPYVLSVLFGANLSYATPMAYQTNLLVMDAAGYRFADFVRVGAPLVLLMLVTLSYLLSRQYGL